MRYQIESVQTHQHECRHPKNFPIPSKCVHVARTILEAWEREHSQEGLLLGSAFKAPHTLASFFLPRFLLIPLFMQPTFHWF